MPTSMSAERLDRLHRGYGYDSGAERDELYRLARIGRIVAARDVPDHHGYFAVAERVEAEWRRKVETPKDAHPDLRAALVALADAAQKVVDSMEKSAQG